MKRFYALTALLFMMFAPLSINAQPGFQETVDDESTSTAPINGYVYAGVLAAGIIGYAATRQKKATV
ncbi:hypothetical protein AM493_13065 [Flavobacterium akiainvivens]|uniref:Signal peptidase n=2 Tax=Flavobacterium akiainvivens TaxID=1202724 RepID=A0A0M8MA85_9FLAO|nr:hypothetical protein AM493_13065 [Flavobacterium akiainvivens]